MEKADFRALAVKLEGSRDVGAQLFCAFLRSAGVDARVVCSLQPLPLNATVKTITTQTPKPHRIVEEMRSRPGTSDEDSGVDIQHDVNPFGHISSGKSDSPAPLVPMRPRRLGQPTFALENNATVPKTLPLKCALPPATTLLLLMNDIQYLNVNASKSHHIQCSGSKRSMRRFKSGFLSIP